MSFTYTFYFLFINLDKILQHSQLGERTLLATPLSCLNSRRRNTKTRSEIVKLETVSRFTS